MISMRLKIFRVFALSLCITAVLVAVKFGLHALDFEIIRQGTLHNSVAAGAFFVIGFLLSATIADYKESERIPSEFASIIENMYADSKSISAVYKKYKPEQFRKQLISICMQFRKDVRNKTHEARLKVQDLSETFIEMEKAGAPPNFLVKLKQQQAQLGRSLFRVNYIQNIRVIPSATVLAYSIVSIATLLLLFTEIEPFFGGVLIMATINFILVYMLLLIQVITTPFRSSGETMDDVSLYLIDETIEYLEKK